MRLFLLLVFGLVFSPVNLAANSGDAILHQLEVKLDPDDHVIQVTDVITLPDLAIKKQATKEVNKAFIFSLHPALKLKSLNQEVIIRGVMPPHKSVSKFYSVSLPSGVKTFTLAYAGKIHDALEAYGKEQSRGFRSTSGIIAPEGIYLAGSSNWYPEFIDQRGVTFELNIELPKGWIAISQGDRSQDKLSSDQLGKQTDKKVIVGWKEPHLQEEIYLIAARFKEYSQQSGKVTAQVFLREPDEALANKYLEATSRYLEMYETLLGDYPYSKFALLENFWETGYGMPSFTLLGSKVIRLPFILNTSYPHEILHNWWGNGVYVDYQSGNWSEGLTAYLADHLIKEQQNRGAAYRQQSLQSRYALISMLNLTCSANWQLRKHPLHSPGSSVVKRCLPFYREKQHPD